MEEENIVDEFYDLIPAIEAALKEKTKKDYILKGILAEGIEPKKANKLFNRVADWTYYGNDKVLKFGFNNVQFLAIIFILICVIDLFLIVDESFDFDPIYLILGLMIALIISPPLLNIYLIYNPKSSNSLVAFDLDGFIDKNKAKNRWLWGLKQGRWVEYINDGQWVDNESDASFYRLAIYWDGEEIGKVRTFYKNGKLNLETNYIEGKEEGVEQEYYEDGKLMAERTYKNGLLEGIESTYAESGKLIMETQYVDNQKHGLEKHYYESGKLKSVIPYEKGKKNGQELHYSGTGEITEKIYNMHKEDED